MRAIDRLEHHAELLRIRKRAGRREGIVFVILLVLLLLAVAVVSTQAGYEPDVVGLFSTALVSLGIITLASAIMAEYRSLGDVLQLMEVLRCIAEEDALSTSVEAHQSR